MVKRVSLFVAGVQKGGTTALESLLRDQPNVRMAKIKEPHFFDNDELDWRRPDYAAYHRLFDPSRDDSIVGEATPIYSYWPNALERIATYNAGSYVVLCLRHPSFRAHSHWRMETARGAETFSFSDAIRARGRERVLEAPGGVHRVYSYVERGFYSSQIERAVRLFGQRRTLVLRTDELWRDPSATLRTIREFLDLAPDDSPSESRYTVPLDARSLGPMNASDREYLDAVYEADIRATAELGRLDLSDWLDPTYEEPMDASRGGDR
ncbi:MAG TPA: sulfotransferase domain-containing protein [Candidatus Tumulicola sp.]|jgi:hypothetical protein